MVLMTKRSISFALAAVLAFSLLAGCASGQTPASSAPEGSASAAPESAAVSQAPAEKVKLTVYGWHAERADSYKKIGEMFTEKYPNLEMNFEAKASDQYYSLLNTAIQAGEAPDLFTSHGNKTADLSQLIAIGACVPLDGQIDLTGFPEIMIKKTLYDGKMYMSPGAFYDTEPVYYNKTLFDKYGLSEPKTYDELLGICDTLLSNGITPFTIGSKEVWAALWFPNVLVTTLAPDWVNDLSAGKAGFSDPRFVEAYKQMQVFIDKGYFGKDYLSTDGKAATFQFSSGKAAMVVDGSWAASGYADAQDEISVFYMPDREGKRVMLASQDTSTGFSIYSKSEHQEDAINLLNFLMSQEACQVLAQANLNVPAREGLTTSDPLLMKMSKADLTIDQFYNFIDPLKKEGFNPGEDFLSFNQQVIYNKMTVEDMVKNLDSELNLS